MLLKYSNRINKNDRRTAENKFNINSIAQQYMEQYNKESVTTSAVTVM